MQDYHENRKDDNPIVLDQVEKQHVVNLFGMKNSVVQIKGKVNAVNISEHPWVTCVKLTDQTLV